MKNKSLTTLFLEHRESHKSGHTIGQFRVLTTHTTSIDVNYFFFGTCSTLIDLLVRLMKIIMTNANHYVNSNHFQSSQVNMLVDMIIQMINLF